jgi:hypothetical protein
VSANGASRTNQQNPSTLSLEPQLGGFLRLALTRHRHARQQRLRPARGRSPYYFWGLVSAILHPFLLLNVWHPHNQERVTMFRRLVAVSAAALLATGAGAQTAASGSHNPALKNGAPRPVAAPAKGANSFTENQARGRFAKAGYAGLSKLTKRNGVWQGTATKGGKRATVMLDYKGNITAR